jgi:hypothetical protein
MAMSIFDKFKRKAKADEPDGVMTLVESLINDFSGGASREEGQRKLLSMGFCEEDSEYVLDMIEMANGRASMAYIGVPLKNMSSNVDDDPYFRAALKINLDRMPPKPG